jgi:hypothetical protein
MSSSVQDNFKSRLSEAVLRHLDTLTRATTPNLNPDSFGFAKGWRGAIIRTIPASRRADEPQSLSPTDRHPALQRSRFQVRFPSRTGMGGSVASSSKAYGSLELCYRFKSSAIAANCSKAASSSSAISKASTSGSGRLELSSSDSSFSQKGRAQILQ